MTDRPAYSLEQDVGIKGLHQDINRSCIHAGSSRLQIGKGRDQDDWHRIAECGKLPAEGETALTGHVDIDEKTGRQHPGARPIEIRRGGPEHFDLIAGRDQDAAQRTPDRGVIINDADEWLRPRGLWRTSVTEGRHKTPLLLRDNSLLGCCPHGLRRSTG